MGSFERLAGKKGKTSRGHHGWPTEAPKIPIPEGEGSMGSGKTVEQAKANRETGDSGTTDAPDPDVLVRTASCAQRATTEAGVRNE